MAHTFQPGFLFVVGFDDDPGTEVRVRFAEHQFFVVGIPIPQRLALHVDRTKFPPLQGVVKPRFKTLLLFFLGDREPELDDDQIVFVQEMLELWDLPHEFVILLLGAEPHHGLNDRPVVPAAVKEDNLSGVGQNFDVPPEIPLASLYFGRFRQCYYPGCSWIQMLFEPLDGSTLTGSIPPFKNYGNAHLLLRNPFLEVDELRLQLTKLCFVFQLSDCFFNRYVVLFGQSDELVSGFDLT